MFLPMLLVLLGDQAPGIDLGVCLALLTPLEWEVGLLVQAKPRETAKGIHQAHLLNACSL